MTTKRTTNTVKLDGRANTLYNKMKNTKKAINDVLNTQKIMYVNDNDNDNVMKKHIGLSKNKISVNNIYKMRQYKINLRTVPASYFKSIGWRTKTEAIKTLKNYKITSILRIDDLFNLTSENVKMFFTPKETIIDRIDKLIEKHKTVKNYKIPKLKSESLTTKIDKFIKKHKKTEKIFHKNELSSLIDEGVPDVEQISKYKHDDLLERLKDEKLEFYKNIIKNNYNRGQISKVQRLNLIRELKYKRDYNDIIDKLDKSREDYIKNKVRNHKSEFDKNELERKYRTHHMEITKSKDRRKKRNLYKIELHNVKYDEDTLKKLIEDTRKQYETRRYKVNISISAILDVEGKNKDGTKITHGEWTTTKGKTITTSENVREWMGDWDNSINNTLSESNLSPIITGCSTVGMSVYLTNKNTGGNCKIEFKQMNQLGVRLNNIIKSNMYNPTNIRYCFFDCLERGGGINRRSPMTELLELTKVKGYVRTCEIKRILEHYEPANIIVHKVDEQKDEFYNNEHTQKGMMYYPNNKNKAIIKGLPVVHLLLIDNHFIYIKSSKIINKIKPSYFEKIKKVETNNDIDMTQEIKTNAIKFGTKLTITPDVIFWDVETFKDDNLHHNVYNVGILEANHNNDKRSDEQLYNETKTLYGVNAWNSFEDYIIDQYEKRLKFINMEYMTGKMLDHKLTTDILDEFKEWKNTEHVNVKITDETIKKRLYGYKKYDDKKGYKTDLDLNYVYNKLDEQNAMCVFCGLSLDNNNFSLDRIDNSKGHTIENVNCCCHTCNVSRKNLFSVDEYKQIAKYRGFMIEKYGHDDEMDDKQLYYDLVNKYKLICYAHNGSNYDHQFVLKSSRFHFESLINQGGLMSITVFKNIIQFRDTMKMTGARSLDALCKDFKLDKKYSKTSFPHEFSSVENLNYVGKVPDSKYWINEIIPDEYKNLDVFDFKKISLHYQKLDCVSLYLIWKKYYNVLNSITGLSIYNYMSSPALSYEYMISNSPSDIEYVVNKDVDHFIRESIQGGRTFPQKPRFNSKHYELLKGFEQMTEEEKKTVYNQIDDYLTDMDACSLYPSSMYLNEYPIGKPYWVNDLDKLNNELMNGIYNKHSIIEFESTFPNKQIITPLLSSKAETLKYTLEDQKYIKTSVDIMEAIKYNKMKITKIYRALEWKDSEYIFRGTIKKLFDGRLQAKIEGNDALQFGLKTVMNSGYGKMSERIKEDKAMFINDLNKFDQWLMEDKIKEFDISNNFDQVFIRKELRNYEIKINKPAHLGAFILAYSKKIMNEAIDKMGGFRDWKDAFYYTDTDSVHIHINQLKYLQENTDLIGENMGQLHDDVDILKDGKIIRAVFVRPKVYIDEIIGYDKEGKIQIKYHRRCKGVKKDLVDKMKVDDFEDMLCGKVKSFDMKLFKRDYKHFDKPAVETFTQKKEINKTSWKGRKLDLYKNYYAPIGSSYADH
jgi:hypothetical protein